MTPSSRRVGFNPAAELDFSEILQYTLTEWGEDKAQEYMNSLLASIDSLAMFGEMGRERTELEPGMRSFPSKEHVIFYTSNRSITLIWRILHNRHEPTPADFE